MEKIIALFLFFCLGFVQAQDIKEKSELDALLDSLFTIDTLSIINASSSFLYASAQYDNQVYFSGRDFEIDQYGFAPSLTYMNTNGLFVNLGALYYSALEPAWDLVAAGVGHFWYLNSDKSMSVQGSFNRFFYAEEQDGLNKNLLSTGLSCRKKKLGAGLGVGYLFGGDATYYITLRTDYNIDLAEWGKVEIGVRPSIDLLFSQQNITEQVSLTEVTERDVFDLINTQLAIPLEIDVGSFDVELSYNINLPKALPDEESLSTNGFVSIGVGYILPFWEQI